MDDLVEFIGVMVIGMFGIGFGIFVLIFAVAAGPMKWACSDYGQMTKLETNYSVWEGCIVTMPNGAKLMKQDAQQVLTREFQHRYQLEIEGRK